MNNYEQIREIVIFNQIQTIFEKNPLKYTLIYDNLTP